MADEEYSEKTAIFVGGILEADRDFLQCHNGKNISSDCITNYIEKVSYCSPIVRITCTLYNLSQKGLTVIVSILAAQGTINYNGTNISLATLFFLETNRFCALLKDIQQQLGDNWTENLSEDTIKRIFCIAYPHIERPLGVYCFQSFRNINIDGGPEKSSSVGNVWLLATIIFCGLGLVLCGVSVKIYTIAIVGIIAIFGVILYLMMHGFFLNIFAGIKKVCVFLAEIGKSFFEELILPFSGCLLPIIMEITTFGAIVVTAGWLHEDYRWNLFGAFFAAGCFAHIPFVGKIIAIIAAIQAFNWNPFWAILCFTWHYILFALIAVKKDKIS